MRRIILSSGACRILQNVSTLPHKRHDFRESVGGGEAGKLLNIKCVFITFV